MHDIFKGEALRFFMSNVKGKERTIGGAVQLMREHFNGIDKQQRIKAELSATTLDNFIQKSNGIVRDGLSSLSTYINNRISQCRVGYRTEQHKVDFLRQAVIGTIGLQMFFVESPQTIISSSYI